MLSINQSEISNTWIAAIKGSREVKAVSIKEIEKFIDMIIFTGMVKLSNHRMYWHPGTKNKLIANAIPVNRVPEMLRVIQFNTYFLKSERLQ